VLDCAAAAASKHPRRRRRPESGSLGESADYLSVIEHHRDGRTSSFRSADNVHVGDWSSDEAGFKSWLLAQVSDQSTIESALCCQFMANGWDRELPTWFTGQVIFEESADTADHDNNAAPKHQNRKKPVSKKRRRASSATTKLTEEQELELALRLSLQMQK
jgi:hypothetical protein